MACTILIPKWKTRHFSPNLRELTLLSYYSRLRSMCSQSLSLTKGRRRSHANLLQGWAVILLPISPHSFGARLSRCDTCHVAPIGVLQETFSEKSFPRAIAAHSRPRSVNPISSVRPKFQLSPGSIRRSCRLFSWIHQSRLFGKRLATRGQHRTEARTSRRQSRVRG